MGLLIEGFAIVSPKFITLQLTRWAVVSESNGEESNHGEVPGLEQRPPFYVVKNHSRDERAEHEAPDHIDEQRNGRREFLRQEGHSPFQLFELFEQKIGSSFHYVIE